MDFNTLYEQKVAHSDKSFALIAERCEHSKNAPYGIREAKAINPDNVLVLALPGSHNAKDATCLCNGFLKQIVNETTFEYPTDKIDFYVAVDGLLKPFSYGKTTPISSASKDIFKKIYLPRLEKYGDTTQAKDLIRKRLQKVIVVAYCQGFSIALELEILLALHLLQLGFSAKETAKLQQQMLIMAFAPNCDINLAKSNVTAIVSAGDISSTWISPLVEYTHRYIFVEDFGFCIDIKPGKNILYCAQYNKNGVEGSPHILRVVNPECFMVGNKNIKNTKPHLGEHDFIGFIPRPEMSKASKIIQKMAKNLYIKAIDNQINNRGKNIKYSWLYENDEEKINFTYGGINYYKLMCKSIIWRCFSHQSFIKQVKLVEID